MAITRREFVVASGAAMAARDLAAQPASAADHRRMRAVAAFTAETLSGPNPMCFGALIVNTATGEECMRAMNAVGPEHDPSAHAETRTIRLACAKLGSSSLKGHTLYTTCEPCPMCMSCALWANMDRVVFGATIDDAAKFVSQIYIPAKEVARRSDMKCIVDGPVEREACMKIFTDPRMQKAFAMWKKK